MRTQASELIPMGGGPGRQNRASEGITSQLKNMSTDELKAGGAEYKALIEARDLEDVLFS
jgi:hypothetical protein